MPRPGRRRTTPTSSPLLAILTTLLLLFIPAVLAQNGVLGVDIGTEYLKAALVKPGIPLEIVLTKDSRRKETSALAFKSGGLSQGKAQSSDGQLPERLYGADALALAVRFPGDVYPNLKWLVGAGHPGREDVVKTYKERYPALDLFAHKENNTLAFRSQAFPDTHPAYSVEELLAMELKSIKSNAEAMAGSNVGAAVITVPPFFAADERRAVELAAELAGLRVIGLVSDGMAVGLNYAMSRTFANVDEGEKPEYHLVYDMGAGSTTATLLRMQGRTVKDVGRKNKTIQEVSTIGLGWDRTLGGDALNDLIVADMVEKFVASSAAQKASVQASAIKKHGRTMAKFWREAERLRQVLSANTATSGNFESLYEDIDFKYKLSRSDFEEMTADFGLRVAQPITDALDAAGLTIQDLTSVILHGGAVRTPFVQASLETVTGGASKLKSNVNADEAAVFGAAFKAAGLSPSFRVKEIKDNDVAVYPVTLHWTSNGKDRKQQIFVPTSQTGAAKQMPFKQLDDFSFSFSQQLPLVGKESPVLDVKATNVTASVARLIADHGCVRENISTVVSIRMDPIYGLPEVTRGTVSCEAMEAEKKGMMDGVKDMFGFGKKDQIPLDGEDEELIEPLPESTSASTSSSTTPSGSSSASSATASGKAKEPKPPVKKTFTIPLSFETKKTGLLQPTGETLQRIRDGLTSFDLSDKGRRLREDLYNGLEGFAYKVRDMLTDASFTSVSTESQRTELEKLLGTTKDWLSDEGSSAGIDAIKEKLQALRGLVDPVQKRKDEITNRPIAIEKLQDALGLASSLRDSVSESISSAADAASLSALEASASAASVAASATENIADTASSLTEGAADTFSSVTEGVADAVSSATEGAASGASTVSSAASSASEDPSAAYSSIMAQISALSSTSSYTETDLSRLTSLYDDTKAWLEEKILAQSGLGESDEPAFGSAEVLQKTEELKRIVEELKRKKVTWNLKDRSSSSASSKKAGKTKARSKTKAGKSAKSSSTTGSPSASASASVTLEVPGAQSSDRDEL